MTLTLLTLLIIRKAGKECANTNRPICASFYKAISLNAEQNHKVTRANKVLENSAKLKYLLMVTKKSNFRSRRNTNRQKSRNVDTSYQIFQLPFTTCVIHKIKNLSFV